MKEKIELVFRRPLPYSDSVYTGLMDFQGIKSSAAFSVEIATQNKNI